jgi:hypothetical protein
MAIFWVAQTIPNRGWPWWIRVYAICYIHGQFHSPTFTAHHVHRLLSWHFSAHKANLGRDNNARIRSLRIEIDHANVQSKITSKNSQKTVQKHFSNEMKIHFFIEDTHLPPKIFQMHQQSLDHSYCKRETSLTKLKNSIDHFEIWGIYIYIEFYFLQIIRKLHIFILPGLKHWIMHY